MVFAYFVCAILLITILYFLALMLSSVLLWSSHRFSQIERSPLTILLNRGRFAQSSAQ